MPQFFVDISGKEKICEIEGKDFWHLTKVRRVRVGDLVNVRNKSGALYICKVMEIFDNSMRVEIIDQKIAVQNVLNVTLGIAVLKGWKFEFVIQKAVEIGVSRVVPLLTERSVPQLEGKEKNKVERWRKIALEAAKQCMRGNLPEIDCLKTYDEFIVQISEGIKLIAHPHRNAAQLHEIIKDLNKGMCTIAIGPEGGFSEREINAALNVGWKAVKCGDNLMRAETAAIVLPAILMYEWSKHV
ncbi:MAG: 16S rRNA (uracil(1498)-N(3))-methyltransferase [Spirochaetes bacterium]|nr:16S rRNA (uracil(1498)-N(3))-methyltransferase [Spirochaetota bacterium]